MTVERLTLAQIATSSLAAARTLEGYGIDYCDGSGRTLSDACAALGLDCAALQRELESVSDEPPDDRDWTTPPLHELIEFLKAEHVHVRTELAVLEARLSRVVEAHGDRYEELVHLTAVFRRLCEDLDVHMLHEERDVFPAIRQYLDAMKQGRALKGTPLSAFGGPLRMMETEHESSGAALRLLREFAHDYRFPADGCPRYQMVIRGMLALEDRLLRHIYLENNVLFARAARLRPGQVGVSS